MHDIIIIGGGPAGLSAAITARARNKDVLVISNPPAENPLASSKAVENYPGMPGTTGLEILKTMYTQAEELGVEFLQARAISIIPMQASAPAQGAPTHASFSVTTSSDFVEARALIIASGAAGGGKPIKGELEFLGSGVSYCATCDGMLYRDSTVLIAGLSSEAAEEANFMAELGATVHYVSKEAPAHLSPSIQQYEGKLTAIKGDIMGVKSTCLLARRLERDHSDATEASQRDPGNQGNSNTQKDDIVQEIQLDVDGVFILRPGIAPTSMLASLETENGYIKVDAGMGTNVEGVFAAGDCTGKPLQIAKAVGQGQIAVLSAVEYL